MGWNVCGAKCPRAEMYKSWLSLGETSVEWKTVRWNLHGSNVHGVERTGDNCPGLISLWSELSMGWSCRRLPPVTARSTRLSTTGRTQSHRATLWPCLKTNIIEISFNKPLDKNPHHFEVIFLYILIY